MAARCYSGTGANGKTAKTVRKINLKRKDITAISKVKPSLLRQIQIKLMVDESVHKDIINILF